VAELSDAVVLVTGAAMGLGEAIARHASAAGASVALVDRDLAAAQRVARDLPGARAYAADVSALTDMERVCAEVVRHFGRLTGAVNNAGIGGEMGPLLDCTPDNWGRVIGINLTGVFNSLRAELPYLLSAGGGSIVNMASMAGVVSDRNMPAYTASKHGVVGLTKAVALDYGTKGIRCNALCPSFVRTPMTLTGMPDPKIWEEIDRLHPIGRTVTADEVAEVATFLLSTRAGGMTGSVHLVDGGVGAH
jgi:NAD(P)-dependent dehydrogenase (short-subunit alcohol dehydrogenase family)